MTDIDVQTFIERMEELGDVWEKEDVERVYGDKSLDQALSDRMGDLNTFGNIIATVLNRDE